MKQKFHSGCLCIGQQQEWRRDEERKTFKNWENNNENKEMKGKRISNLRRRGRAIAQTVSRRLPTAAARVRAQVKSCGTCCEQNGTGAGFLRVLQFPLPILIPPTAPHSSSSSSSIIWGWYKRPISGRRTKWTQSHPTPWN
jgi:hypothetical protein